MRRSPSGQRHLRRPSQPLRRRPQVRPPHLLQRPVRHRAEGDGVLAPHLPGDLGHHVAHGHQRAGADVGAVAGRPAVGDRRRQPVDHVVDEDPVDRPDAAGELRRRPGEQRGDRIGDQLRGVALPRPVDHVEPERHHRQLVEVEEHPAVDRAGVLGGGVGRARLELAAREIRLLHRAGEHAARAAGLRQADQRVHRALQVVAEGRQHRADVAGARDHAGEVHEGVRPRPAHHRAQAVDVGEIRLPPADAVDRRLRPARDRVHLRSRRHQPGDQMPPDEAAGASNEHPFRMSRQPRSSSGGLPARTIVRSGRHAQ